MPYIFSVLVTCSVTFILFFSAHCPFHRYMESIQCNHPDYYLSFPDPCAGFFSGRMRPCLSVNPDMHSPFTYKSQHCMSGICPVYSAPFPAFHNKNALSGVFAGLFGYRGCCLVEAVADVVDERFNAQRSLILFEAFPVTTRHLRFESFR